VSTNSAISLRTLRSAGYLIAAMMIVLPLVDVIARTTPYRIHSPAWRLELVNLASNSVGTGILGLLLMLGIAAASGDRGVAFFAAGLSGVATVGWVGLTGVFALDALEMRGQPDANATNQYDAVTIWLAIRVLIAIVMLLALAVSGFRAAKVIRREFARTPSKGNPALVVGTGRAGIPSPASQQRGVTPDAH